MGQSYRWTHCLKNLHCYNLKSLIFKHSPLLIHTFKHYDYTAQTFFCKPIVHKCCPNTLLQLWETSLPRKKNLKPALLVQYSPPHPGKGEIPTPGKALQIKFPTSRVQKMFKCEGFAWTFDLIGALGEDGRKMLYYYITSCSKSSRRGQKAWSRTNMFWKVTMT